MSNEEKKGKAFLSFIPKLVVSAIYSFLVVYFFEWKYAIFTARPLLEGHFGLAVLAFFFWYYRSVCYSHDCKCVA